MNLATINSFIDSLRARVFAFFSRMSHFRRRLFLFLAVVGPGIITSNVDNDAGGIATYTQAGSAYGYALLWSLIPMTVALYVTMEMCARMGVVTGKGLSDLIREEFGLRPTFFVMITGFLVDLFNVVAEFAGVAAAGQLFGLNKYVTVPLAAIIVWILVLKGTYRFVEVVFLVLCSFYLAYLFSALLAHPDWVHDGTAAILYQNALKRAPQIPQVPTLSELMLTDEGRAIARVVAGMAEIGRSILVTPGVPEERVAALRTAFQDMLKDPDFLAACTQRNLTLDPGTGPEMDAITQDTMNLPKPTVDALRALLKG